MFGATALFGSTRTFSVYPSCLTEAATLPGPTLASAEPTEARYGDGGARLVSTAAAKTAAVTSTASTETRPRRSEAAGVPSSGRPRAATSWGFVRRRLTEATSIAAASRPALTRIAWP